MAISELISTSFLFSIAIIVILIGGIFAYVNYKISQQDHKFTSMIGLISTMTDEIQYLKTVSNGSNSYGGNSYGGNSNVQERERTNFVLGHPSEKLDNRISVSDDEYEDEDEDVNDDVNEEEESEESEDSDSDSESDSEDSESDSESDSEESNDYLNKSSIEITNLEEDHILNDDILENDIKILNLESNANENAISEPDNNIKSIHLEEQFDINFDNFSADIDNVDENINISDLKTISITMTDISASDFGIENGDDSGKNKSTDYKKMALNELKKVVVKKGLTNDASKLKKNELLKMLDDE